MSLFVNQMLRHMLALEVYGSGIDSKMIRYLMALPIKRRDLVSWSWVAYGIVEDGYKRSLVDGFPNLIAN
jgi:hypothetical protein